MFCSVSAFRLFLLFVGFCCCFTAINFMITSDTTVSLFDNSIMLYKFDYLNFSHLILFDGIALNFMCLTLFLFLVCVLLS